MSGNSNKEFKAGDIVLAPFTGYPPWPAVIIPYQYLLDKKKSKNFLSILKDKKNTGNALPICYLNDDYYDWFKPSSLAHLTPEMIDNFDPSKVNLKSAHPDDLQGAYDTARGPNVIQTELIRRNLLDSVDGYQASNALPTDEQYQETFPKKKLPARVKAAPVQKSKVATKRKRFQNINSEEESLGDDQSKNDSGSEEPEVKKTKEEDSFEEDKKKALDFRRKLQKGLLQRSSEPSVDELNECSETLQELDEFLPNITADILRVSKLHKVLKAIVKTPQLASPDVYKFHLRSNKILVDWWNEIDKLKKEKENNQSEVLNSSISLKNDDSIIGKDILSKSEAKEDGSSKETPL